jgi:hypothetical protein
MADQEITLGMLMEQLRAMESRFNSRFAGIDRRLEAVELKNL